MDLQPDHGFAVFHPILMDCLKVWTFPQLAKIIFLLFLCAATTQKTSVCYMLLLNRM